MPKKLKSVLKSLRVWQLTSALKALVFSGLLMIADDWPTIFIFIAVSSYLYFRPFFKAGQFFASFAVFTAVSLMAVRFPMVDFRLSAAACGVLFFVLLGVKNFLFVHRQLFYYLFGALTTFSVFILFFGADKSFFVIGNLAVGLAVFLLFRDFLGVFEGPEKAFSLIPAKKTLFSAVFAFLMFQILWVLAFLPVGFVNAASLAILIVLIFEDLIVNYFGGTLNRRAILRSVTAFLALATVIFGASEWLP